MSPMYYLFVIGFIVLAGYFYFIGIRGNSRWKKQNAHASVGEMAKRFHWEILEGDPTFNLVVPNRFSPLAPKEVNVRMEGKTYGHPMELFYHDKRWTEQTLLETKQYHEFTARLTLKAEKALPSIEIYSKKPGFGITIETHLKLPRQSFGDPMLDDVLVLETVDPTLGLKLAPHLGALLAIGYVHIIVDAHQVSLEMTEVGMAYAMQQVDQWVYTLETIACVLTDKPIPGQIFFDSEAPSSKQETQPNSISENAGEHA